MDHLSIASKTAAGLKEANGVQRTLPDSERAFVRAVDGASTVEALATKLKLRVEEAVATASRLETGGFLREAGRAAAAPSDGPDDLDFTRSGRA